MPAFFWCSSPVTLFTIADASALVYFAHCTVHFSDGVGASLPESVPRKWLAHKTFAAALSPLISAAFNISDDLCSFPTRRCVSSTTQFCFWSSPSENASLLANPSRFQLGLPLAPSASHNCCCRASATAANPVRNSLCRAPRHPTAVGVMMPVDVERFLVFSQQ